jgi:hypothetical protein
MTRVCLVGDDDVNLRYELLSRETAREALATYDLREPFANAVGVETVSLGSAVALLNDLEWYLVRFVDEAMVLEPSVSDDEWLSRDLATAIRDDEVGPEESARYLKVYGLVGPDDGDGPTEGDGPRARDGPGTAESTGGGGDTGTGGRDGTGAGDTHEERGDGDTRGEGEAGGDAGPPELVEPMFVTRTGPDIPDYDLREVDGTVVERVTEAEFGA